VRDVDAVEQHRQLRRVELSAQCLVVESGQLEATLLEPLVPDDKAAAVPAQDLHAVAPPRDKDEEMAGVDILAPTRAHERGEAVDAVPQVHRLRGEQDADGAW
jgi:hypothetical protein